MCEEEMLDASKQLVITLFVLIITIFWCMITATICIHCNVVSILIFQICCFNYGVVTLVAIKQKRQWLGEVYFGISIVQPERQRFDYLTTMIRLIVTTNICEGITCSY